MSNTTCIFHHPFPVKNSGDSGSQVRPAKILSAFEQLGFGVQSVTGYGAERKKQIAKITSEIEAGRSFDFAYSESHTIPTLLTEPHHLPTYPLLDFGFLRTLRTKNIPVGLYYRDIHWRFSQYRTLAWHKKLVTVPFYHYDWLEYRRSVDHLFLPSKGMAAHLPSRWSQDSLSALPPGSDIQPMREQRHEIEQPLRLFYVGGVTPPLYNLQPLFDFTKGLDSLTLTLCCREQEWLKQKLHYEERDDMTVVHASGGDLNPHYSQADLFVMLWKPHPYLDFAMPVKTFEAMAHGVPIITTAGTEVARFVEAEAVGWVVNSADEFRQLIGTLYQHPEKLEQKREWVKKVREKHSWQARAQQIAETLKGYL